MQSWDTMNPMQRHSRAAVLAILLGLLPTAVGWAQTTAAPTVQVVTVPSEALKGSRKATILVPAGYAQSAARYPVLYLLHGLTGSYEDWTKKTNLTGYAAAYGLIIVMPEGENSWYTNSAARADYRYEDFIIKDLIGYVDSNYRSIADRHGRAIAGLSMGGYGAMKLGLKFPALFSSLASFSGALALAQPGLKLQGLVAKTIAETFGPDNHEARPLNDPFELAKKLGAVRPMIYFDCGNSDRLLESNRKFAELLASLKIPYEYREPPGGHTWGYWDSQIQEYLRLLARQWRLEPVRPSGAAAKTSAGTGAEDNLRRVETLVEAGAAPRSALEHAEQQLQDAHDQELLKHTLYAGNVSPNDLPEMLRAAERLRSRASDALAERQKLVTEGVLAANAIEKWQQDLAHAEKQLELAQSRAKLVEEIAEMARREAEQDSALALRFEGKGTLNDQEFFRVETAFYQQFDRPLPVSARGATAVHRSLGFDHRDRFDVALNPDEAEGRWLIRLLQRLRIPYIAYRRPVAGRSTGAHIHVGLPSPPG